MKNHYYRLLFCLIALLSSCEKDDDKYSQGGTGATAINDIVAITNVTADTLPADTQTTSIISLQITQDASLANRTVSLSTDLGTFLNGEDTGSLTVDANGKGRFEIRSAQTGLATISVKLKDTRVNTSVTFLPAMPDEIMVSSDKYLMDSTQAAEISAVLSRDPGKGIVSDPVKVYFTIIGADAEQLQLPAFTHSVSGIAKVTLSNPLAVTGAFTIKALVVNQNGATITRTINIKIQ